MQQCARTFRIKLGNRCMGECAGAGFWSFTLSQLKSKLMPADNKDDIVVPSCLLIFESSFLRRPVIRTQKLHRSTPFTEVAEMVACFQSQGRVFLIEVPSSLAFQRCSGEPSRSNFIQNCAKGRTSEHLQEFGQVCLPRRIIELYTQTDLNLNASSSFEDVTEKQYDARHAMSCANSTFVLLIQGGLSNDETTNHRHGAGNRNDKTL